MNPDTTQLVSFLRSHVRHRHEPNKMTQIDFTHQIRIDPLFLPQDESVTRFRSVLPIVDSTIIKSPQNAQEATDAPGYFQPIA